MNLLVISGLTILLLLLLWLVGKSRAAEPSGPPTDLEYRVQLPSQTLLARCFSTEDVAYVGGYRSPALSQLLYHERRRLAVEWLRTTRREAGRLYRLHVRAARYARDLRPATETGLFFQFGLFVLVYRLVTTLVWFYGPLRAQVLGRSVQSLAAVLAGLGGRIAGSVAPRATPDLGSAYGD